MTTRAIVLAAGRGGRLGQLTDDTPKCMLPLAGKPLLHHQFDVLERAGISDIVVVCGYLAGKVDARGHVKRLNPQFARTNMVHTLFCVEDAMTDDFIVSYGDIVYGDAVLETLLRAEGAVQVAVDKEWEVYWRKRGANPLDDAETLRMDDVSGRLLELGRKPESLSQMQGQYIGLTRWKNEGVDLLKATYREALADPHDAWHSGRTLEQAYMTDLLNRVCAVANVCAVPIHRGWVEIDSASDLLLAEEEASVFLR